MNHLARMMSAQSFTGSKHTNGWGSGANAFDNMPKCYLGAYSPVNWGTGAGSEFRGTGGRVLI